MYHLSAQLLGRRSSQRRDPPEPLTIDPLPRLTFTPTLSLKGQWAPVARSHGRWETGREKPSLKQRVKC